MGPDRETEGEQCSNDHDGGDDQGQVAWSNGQHERLAVGLGGSLLRRRAPS